MKPGTEETHFSIIFDFSIEELNYLLAEAKNNEESLKIGVVIGAKDATYRTYTNTNVPITRIVVVGDQSE